MSILSDLPTSSFEIAMHFVPTDTGFFSQDWETHSLEGMVEFSKTPVYKPQLPFLMVNHHLLRTFSHVKSSLLCTGL